LNAEPRIAERVAAVQARVAAACQRSSRSAAEVVILGASKSQPLKRLLEAWSAGIRVFGENRVQEALRKIPELSPEVEWHLIGPLQTNKVRKVVPHFAAVQSIDRLKIATALDREAARQGRQLLGFIEVNLGQEATKHGFAVEDLASRVESLSELASLRIVGLMSIPPYESRPEDSRPWFRRLRELRDDLFSRPEWSDRPGFLSMGMSHDFEIAVEEGATHVRVGTSLFGPREAQS
jgi:pyridoxal phosphate enzyme (YggS family)